MSNTISTTFILAFSLLACILSLVCVERVLLTFFSIFMLVKVAQCSLYLFEVPLDA